MAISNYTLSTWNSPSASKANRVLRHTKATTKRHITLGTVYINGNEFVCIDQLAESKYMVYINNPKGNDAQQWIFGYYKTFGRALKKADAIVEKREYPKPIEKW